MFSVSLTHEGRRGAAFRSERHDLSSRVSSFGVRRDRLDSPCCCYALKTRSSASPSSSQLGSRPCYPPPSVLPSFLLHSGNSPDELTPTTTSAAGDRDRPSARRGSGDGRGTTDGARGTIHSLGDSDSHISVPICDSVRVIAFLVPSPIFSLLCFVPLPNEREKERDRFSSQAAHAHAQCTLHSSLSGLANLGR